MEVSALGNNIVPQTAGPQTRGESAFHTSLAEGMQPPERDMGRKQRLKQASDKLVASALIKPLLKQVQDSPFRVERFHGGQGEKAFQQRLHTVLADRITRSANFNVAEAVYDKMSQRFDKQVSPDNGAGGEINTHG
jgi:hypothetical protein